MQNIAKNTDNVAATTRPAANSRHNTLLQRWLLVSLMLYLVFVIYGSLVPIQYVPISLDDALQRYSQIRYLNLGMPSRADWVANILLFIPLAFLLAAVSFKPAATGRNMLMALLIMLSGLLLALSIEFIQLYFPQRTVSINDIIAETFGTIFGVGLYVLYGERFKQFLLALALIRGQVSVHFYLLLSYSALFFLYHILPLDLTLSPVELYKKWQDGRIVLLPFSGYKGNLAEVSYAVASNIILWLPIALLSLLHKPDRHKMAFYSRILLLAAVLEFCQLFVYSRVTDLTDIICALLAAVSARFLVKRRPQQQGQISLSPANTKAQSQLPGRPLLLFGAVLLYSFFLLLLFWYPFDFNFDWSFIHSRWQAAQSKVLLQSLYFGTEYRAITSLAQKLLTFIPLGVLFAMTCQVQRTNWQRQLLVIIALLYIASLAGIIEAMQMALPGKTVDLTDALLQLLGAIAGFSAYLFFYRRAGLSATASVATTETYDSAHFKSNPSKQFPPITTSRMHLLLMHLTITLLILLVASQLPVLPYNLRELLTDNNTAIWGLTLSLYLMTLPLVLRIEQFAVFALCSPLLILLQSGVIFLTLYLTVPIESLRDILGSPVTRLPVSIELLLRFCGFFCPLQFNYLFAGRIMQERSKLPALILWAIFSLLYAGIWYLVVVQFAGTDNITELLTDGGSFAIAIGLSVYLALLSGSAVWLSRYFTMPQHRRLLRLCTAILLAFFLCWLMLNAITESLIVKYQQAFSALQFLLSSSRDNYATPAELMLRYAIGHTAIVVLLAWFYALAQRLSPQPNRTVRHHPRQIRMGK